MINEDHEIWLEGVERVSYPRGILPSETDILITGGGITGVTCAYLLTKENKKAVLLEKRELGEGVTDCTTGFLTGVIDTDPAKLIKVFGLFKAKLILASHLAAISEVEKIINLEKIDCDFARCSNYIYANSKSEEKKLLELAEAYNQLGVRAEYKKDGRLQFNSFGYIEIPNQAKFHALKYVFALAKLAVKAGAIIAERMEVLNLEDKGDFVSVSVKEAGLINAKKVISATYTPLGKPKALFGLGNIYRSYVLEYKLPVGILPEGTYEDTLAPYHYFRIDREAGFDRLIIGGADHLDVIKMDREINYQTIRRYAKKLFPNIQLEEKRYWSGQISETTDSLAYIGSLAGGNIFYTFGFSGNGMTYSHIAGRIFLDELLGRPNPYSDIYRLNRRLSWWKKLYLK